MVAGGRFPLLARMRAMRVRARSPSPLFWSFPSSSPLSPIGPVSCGPPRHSVGFPGREEGELAPVGSCECLDNMAVMEVCPFRETTQF